MSMTNLVVSTLLEFRPEHHPAPSGHSALGGVLGLIFGLIGAVIGLGVAAVMVFSMWKLFAKAGQPGWMAIVPIMNLLVLLKMTNKPVWWIVLFCIPGVNAIAMILLTISLAQAFGQSMGFAIGMLFLPVIFYPMLAFGSARYSPQMAYA